MLMLSPEAGTFRLFATALAIGALIGLEREHRRLEDGQPGFAGLRSFVLLSEAGALAMWLTRELAMPLIFIATLLGVSLLVAISHVLESRHERNPGVTTELAAISVFLLGGLVMTGQVALSVALAVANTALLTFKAPLQLLIRKLGQDDLLAGLKLLIASFIVLPLLPDAPIDPWQAINPHKLWLLVILISLLSLVGYVAMRWLGSARGILVTGLAGGLVSSTAVTLSLARESRASAGSLAQPDDAYAAGILIAWSVMFVRVAGMLLFLNAALLHAMAVPMAAMFVVCVAGAAVFYRRSPASSSGTSEVPLKNPFSLWAACKFGLLFAGVLVLVALTRHSFADAGVLYVSVIAGTTDVDAISLSMAEIASDPQSVALAANAVIACTLSNTVTKALLAATQGRKGLAMRLGLVTALTVLAGVAALFF